jgi:hypothetical protein
MVIKPVPQRNVAIAPITNPMTNPKADMMPRSRTAISLPVPPFTNSWIITWIIRTAVTVAVNHSSLVNFPPSSLVVTYVFILVEPRSEMATYKKGNPKEEGNEYNHN